MTYPILHVRTKDGIQLHGLFMEAKTPKTIFIHVHGTASNFYEEDFIEVLTEKFARAGISMLSTNNRGAGVYDAYQKTGAAVEIFEQCLIDIDAWIEFARQKGYAKIILAGHSLGTEKVVYYMRKGKYRKYVSGLVLLAPADSPGNLLFSDDYEPSAAERKRVSRLLQDARNMIRAGKSGEFLRRTAYAGIMPKTPESLINTLGPRMEILNALPFHTRKLESYRKIRVPIFAAIGDQSEYTAIPPLEALELMRRENPRAETHQLKNCDHDFTDREKELTELVWNFIRIKVL